jgi:hypothetical protein
VTHNPSRKQFFAKLFGAVAAVAAFPKLFAKSAASGTTPRESAPAKPGAMPVKVRPETRAVARGGDSL